MTWACGPFASQHPVQIQPIRPQSLNRNITKSKDLLNAQSEMSWLIIKQLVFLVVILVFGGYYGGDFQFQIPELSILLSHFSKSQLP